MAPVTPPLVVRSASFIAFVSILLCAGGARASEGSYYTERPDDPKAVYLKAAAAHGLGYWRTFFSVRLPAMLPHLMSGFKLAVAYSVIGVIAGEFILSSRGLGRAIAFAYNNFDNPTMYALLLLVVALTIAVNLLLSSWEQAMYRRWQR